MATETFDAVLAEMREYADDESQCFNAAERLWAIRQDELGDWADRLAAAHAAEVAERDALLVELDGLKAQLEHHTAYTIVHRGALRYCNSSMRDAYSEEHHRAEAAERDARQAVGLLREVADEQIEPPQTESLIARIDAFLAAIDSAIAQQEAAHDR